MMRLSIIFRCSKTFPKVTTVISFHILMLNLVRTVFKIFCSAAKTVVIIQLAEKEDCGPGLCHGMPAIVNGIRNKCVFGFRNPPRQWLAGDRGRGCWKIEEGRRGVLEARVGKGL